MLYLNYNVRKYIKFFIIPVECISNVALRRFHEHSVPSPSISRSTMISSIFFSLLLALTARECLAGIIVETERLDQTSIVRAAVSTLLFNFDSFMYSLFVSKNLCRIIFKYSNSSKNYGLFYVDENFFNIFYRC